MRGAAMAAARKHLDYILRDGVARDGSPGRLYCAHKDNADGRSFIGPWAEDRHHFRIVVSAEDGARYEDLKPLVRRFMGAMEEDLGTGLDWVAADHVDTLYPHTHIMLRGRDDLGADLIIAPDYVRRGMGERVARLVSLDLGPANAVEDKQLSRLDVNAERLTSIDRELVRRMDSDRAVSPGGRELGQRAMLVGRLVRLRSLGLAEKLEADRWRLADDFEEKLGRFDRQGEAIRSIEQGLDAVGFERARSELVVHNPDAVVGVTGRLVCCGRLDETTNRRSLIIDGIDGRCHHIDVGEIDMSVQVAVGAILHVQRKPNILDIEILSPLPLDELVQCQGETWLDRELASPKAFLRDVRFGRDVGQALAARRSWLIEQGLESSEQDHARNPGANFPSVAARRPSHLIGRQCSTDRNLEHKGELVRLPWRTECGPSISEFYRGIENVLVPRSLHDLEI